MNVDKANSQKTRPVSVDDPKLLKDQYINQIINSTKKKNRMARTDHVDNKRKQIYMSHVYSNKTKTNQIEDIWNMPTESENSDD